MGSTTKTNTKTKLIHFLQAGVTAFLTLLIIGCSTDIPSIKPSLASEMLAKNEAIMIDVREQDEWDDYHIEGAMLVPLTQIKKHTGALEKYKDQTVVLLDQGDRRSNLAADTLFRAGFSKVYIIEGGILAWNEEGLAIVQGVR
jgi:rhodanese-related sulfurtransferase